MPVCRHCRYHNCNGCPSPEEIAAACLAIRAEWSEAEHWRRAQYHLNYNGRPVHCDVPRPRWTVPEVRCAVESGVH